MSGGSEIAIRSEDGETTVVLRGDADTLRITHDSSAHGVICTAEIDLKKHGSEQARAILNGYRTAAEKPDAASITYMRLTRLGRRARFPMRLISKISGSAFGWLAGSHEDTNFTYELTEQSKSYLAHTVALTTNSSVEQIKSYIEEAEKDEELRKHISEVSAQQPDHIRAVNDERALFGRRLGWYAVTRATKPKLVIETGVDKGLGGILLCAALRRNKDEGVSGRYLGTDINPAAGYLITSPYSDFGHVAYGDSLETLKTIKDEVDLFINDSDHSAEYEAQEFKCIEPLLSETAIVLSDNSHSTTKLAEFAEQTDRKFLFWREQPSDHWYPGAGIGFAFR
jgi:predicted O-methyltransferase YrrM